MGCIAVRPPSKATAWTILVCSPRRSGVVSQGYDSAHTVDRSGKCPMSLAPEVRDMVLLAPSRGSVVKRSLSHYLTTWRCLNPTPASPTQPLRARVGGRRCAPHYTLCTRMLHTLVCIPLLTPKAQQGGVARHPNVRRSWPETQQGGSLAIQTCDDLGVCGRGGGAQTRTYCTIHFDPALPHACSRGGVWD